MDPLFDIGQTGGLEFMQLPGMNFNMPSLASPSQTRSPGPVDYPTPESRLANSSTEDSLKFQQDLLAGFQLPDNELLAELVTLFFKHLYHMFPCFHKRSFLANVQNGHFQAEVPLLLYAICCIASRFHPETAVRKRQADWYEQAKFSYDLTRRFPNQGFRTIQAVLLLIYHAYTIGDFSSSWLFVGKAWRQAVALGMNRMDAATCSRAAGDARSAEEENVFDVGLSRGRTAVEREEYRRTLWLLYILDRNNAWYVFLDF